MGFEFVLEDLRPFIKETSCSFNAAAIIEGHFHYIKAAARKRPDERLGHIGIWNVGPTKKLLRELYNFREVAADEAPEPNAGESVPSGVFSPVASDLSTPKLRDIVACRAPSCTTFRPPEAFHACAQDFFLMNEFAPDNLHSLPNAWRTIFLQDDIVVRHKSRKGFWLCLGCLRAVAILWPLEVQKVAKVSAFTLKGLANIKELWLVALVDFDGWFGVPFRLRSPLYIWLMSGKKASQSVKLL